MRPKTTSPTDLALLPITLDLRQISIIESLRTAFACVYGEAPQQLGGLLRTRSPPPMTRWRNRSTICGDR